MKKCISDKERKFLEWLFEQVFEGSPDGGDIQDKAEEIGLLIPVKISEDDKEKYPACYEYDTDTLLFPYWTKEARGAIRRAKRGRE